ncbi:MAG: anti-FecI sigma factor, FecR [Mucilaginibacter sp.]|nr:anti-FecI sigma factor, FecR [Mucilaginibacter sp.]
MTSEERVWFLSARSVSGDISPEEVDELELIFLARPELRADYGNIKRLKLDTPVAASIEERGALERGLKKLDYSLANEGRFMERHIFNHEPTPLSSKRPTLWMVAASVLVLFTAGAIILKRFKTAPTNTQQQLATRYGKRIHTTLPDGTTVWLNSGSTIKYAENLLVDGKREVTLNGEAYFDVKHDTEHPFIVHAGKLNVVVLGTAFNVKAYQGDAYMETTLIRGKVEVLNNDKPGDNVILYPNEKVTINTNATVSFKTKLAVKNKPVDSLSVAADKTTLLPQLPDAAITETAWVSDKLIFKKKNFNDLARQLERWYNVEIKFDNDNYSAKQFTGAFKDEDINEVMRDLQFTEPFHYSIKNNQIHIW